MRQIINRGASGGLAVLFLLALLSCGEDHKLVAITITPDGFTFTNPVPGATLASFKALGEFVHPPESRDITNQVVWSDAFPTIFKMDSTTGVATYQGGCGTNLPITATASTDLRLPPTGNIVTATAVVNITVTIPKCP